MGKYFQCLFSIGRVKYLVSVFKAVDEKVTEIVIIFNY